MNWKLCGWQWLWPNFRYNPGIFLEGLRKMMAVDVLAEITNEQMWNINYRHYCWNQFAQSS
jgi:hypothetical protein